MKYILVYDNNMKRLEKKVNDYMESGYQPVGGIAVINSLAAIGYYQAMVKQ